MKEILPFVVRGEGGEGEEEEERTGGKGMLEQGAGREDQGGEGLEGGTVALFVGEEPYITWLIHTTSRLRVQPNFEVSK